MGAIKQRLCKPPHLRLVECPFLQDLLLDLMNSDGGDGAIRPGRRVSRSSLDHGIFAALRQKVASSGYRPPGSSLPLEDSARGLASGETPSAIDFTPRLCYLNEQSLPVFKGERCVPMSRRWGITSFPILCLILGLFQLPGCGKDGGKNPQAGVDGEPAIPVTVAEAVARDVTVFMTYTGKIEACQDITIRSKIGGILDEVLVEEGDSVKAGQTLARVEDEEYLLAVREAEASLFSARSNLAKITQLSRPQEIDAARAAYERAQADFDKARVTWERTESLYEKRVISKQEYDIAKLDYQSKKATRDAAKENFDLVAEGARTEDIEMAKFQVNQAEARLSLAKKRLNDTRIRSPILGVVTRKMVEMGDLMAVGTPVANVVDIRQVETEVGITEKDLPHIRLDSKVSATVVAYPGRAFSATIVFIGVKADSLTGTFPMKIEFDNVSGLLKPGMVVEVRIEKETYENVVAIPQHAVLDKVTRKVVFVIEDGISRERSVDLGPLVEEDVVIQEGLDAGETFVVVGQQSLKDGSKVKIETQG